MDLSKEIDEFFYQLEIGNTDFLGDLRHRFRHAEKIAIFGAGHAGRTALKIFHDAGVRVDFFCDNDEKKWNTWISGIKCISPFNLPEDIYIVVALDRYKEILLQLEGRKNIFVISDLNWFRYQEEMNPFLQRSLWGSTKEKIESVAEILGDDISKEVFLTILKSYSNGTMFHCFWENVRSKDEQYFPKDLFSLGDHEIFVDCGAYTGDTVKTFLKETGYKFREIHAFEIERENFELMKNAMRRIPVSGEIFCYPYGVWSESGKFPIQIPQEMSIETTLLNAVDGKFLRYVEVRAIDELLFGRDVTFIKMDIEGAELNALRGAMRTIDVCCPKLAISIYHKPEDFFEIPLYIKSLSKGYKIYFRHYTYLDQDTICYAVPPGWNCNNLRG